MLLRVPTWYLPALLCSLLTSSGPGGAMLVLPGSLKPYYVVPRDDHDDSDTDSDDDDDKSTHHHGSSTSTASGRTSVGSGSSATITGSASKSTSTASPSGNRITSHGAVAGIVIACLLFILLLICLTSWCRRRRRTKAQQQAQAAAIAAAAAAEMKEHSHSSTPLLVQQPPNPRTRSTPIDAVPGPLYFSDSPGRHETSQDMPNVAPGTDDGRSLPNPYDGDTPPQLPPRDLLLASPTSPTSHTGPTAWSYSTPAQDASTSSRVSRRESAAPSAWTHDELHSDAASASSAEPLLARDDTQTSRLTASSSLHEEMAGYQKRLEAHHRKESEDAIMREHGIGAGSSVPADPPPVYTAAVDM